MNDVDEDFAKESWQSINDMLAIGVWAVALILITLSIFACLFLWGKLV